MKAFLGRFELVSHDGLAEYADAVRLGYRSRKVLLAATPALAFGDHGGTYSMEIRSSIEEAMLRFTLGREIDEIRSDGVALRTTFDLLGGRLVQTQRGGGIEATITHEIDGDDLTATHVCNGVTCVRRYRRVRGPAADLERW